MKIQVSEPFDGQAQESLVWDKSSGSKEDSRLCVVIDGGAQAGSSWVGVGVDGGRKFFEGKTPPGSCDAVWAPTGGNRDLDICLCVCVCVCVCVFAYVLDRAHFLFLAVSADYSVPVVEIGKRRRRKGRERCGKKGPG